MFRHAGDVAANGLLDICKGLISGSVLGMTPGQRRAANHNEPVFVSGKGHRELQYILPPELDAPRDVEKQIGSLVSQTWHLLVVEIGGLEPPTSALRTPRSPS